MVAIATPALMLSKEETDLVQELQLKVNAARPRDVKMENYYGGSQHLLAMGLAVPPELAGFETIINWNRVVVDEIERRQDIRAWYMPGEDEPSKELMAAFQQNNLDSEAPLLHRQKLIVGRGAASVSTDPDGGDPLIVVESARELAFKIDVRTRRVTAALRLYTSPSAFMSMYTAGTLYLPNQTIYLTRPTGGAWRVESRDLHYLGRVAVVPFLNRRQVGKWGGESEMTDVIPIVDAAARSMTNLQLAQETHAVPTRYVLGISKGDFVDKDGNPLPVWQAYFDRFMASANKDATIGQLQASDLKNFETTFNLYAHAVASVTGMPVRYFGQNPANPAAEGAIIADEIRLIKNVERNNTETGDRWSDIAALWWRFKTGEWPTGPIATDWHNPATPTFAQKADALQKLAGGKPLISREGAWHELGWSEARKQRERDWFDAEARDPQIEAAMRGFADASIG